MISVRPKKEERKKERKIVVIRNSNQKRKEKKNFFCKRIFLFSIFTKTKEFTIKIKINTNISGEEL